MAQHLSDLCHLLIEDCYGEVSAQVFKDLSQRGRITLPTLIQNCALSPRHVRHGLTVLIQQHLVLHFTAPGESTTYYEVDWEGTYNLMRAGKVIAIVEDRFGSNAAQLISNLMQLGHARVGDLEDAYKFTTKSRSAVDSAAEHINGEDMPNGHASSKTQEKKITSRGQLHAVLFGLLEAGFITKVKQRSYYSTADAQNEAEEVVKREEFPEGKVTGPKAKVAYIQSVKTLKRKWRDDVDDIKGDMFKGTIQRGTKRLKTNGAMTNGSSHHANGLDEDIDVTLERDMVLKINYTKCGVAMRSQQLERYAARFVGDTTAKVYNALLILLERKLRRCYDDLDETQDSDQEAAAQPSSTTLDIIDVLSPTLDLVTAIADPSDANGLTNGYHDDDEDDDDVVGATVKRESARPVRDDYGAASIKQRNKRLDHIEQHMNLLAEHPRGFVDKIGTRGKGEWRVNFPALTRSLQRAEIETVINVRFGSIATRLVRMLSSKGKLEEKQVAAFSLMRQKDIRSILTGMQEAGFVEAQEVPKDNTRQPSRTLYFWYFDHERCRQLLLSDTYKAMCRLLQRVHVQRDGVQDVIDKAERLDVVGHEDEYLTTSDKTHLRRWRESEEKLLTQLARQDDMVALLRDFLVPQPS